MKVSYNLCQNYLDTYIACGFDKVPFLFKKGSSGWTFAKIIDDGINTIRKAQIASGSFEKNQTFFKDSELSKGNTVKLDDDVMMKEMNTKHANYINCLKVYA